MIYADPDTIPVMEKIRILDKPVFKLSYNKNPLIRLTSQGKVFYECNTAEAGLEGKPEKINTESFFGDLYRQYHGNEFNFLQYCEIVKKEGKYPDESRISETLYLGKNKVLDLLESRLARDYKKFLDKALILL